MVDEISDSLAPPPLEKERLEPNRIEVIEEFEEDYDTLTEIAEPFNLVVWNDNIHKEEDFIAAFVKYLGFAPIDALERAQEVKENGRAIVLRGPHTDMEFHALALDMNYRITATVESG